MKEVENIAQICGRRSNYFDFLSIISLLTEYYYFYCSLLIILKTMNYFSQFLSCPAARASHDDFGTTIY